MSDFSIPIPLDTTTTHLHFVDGKDNFGQPDVLASATLSGGDTNIASVTLDADGLGAVVQGVALGTSTISVTDGPVTKTVDLVVTAVVLADFSVTADAPAAPAS